jgi:hypothetical protein
MGLSGAKANARRAARDAGYFTTMPLPKEPVVSDAPASGGPPAAATEGNSLADKLKQVPTMYWLIGGVALFFLMGKR